jgi:hypothetical protein
MTWDDRLAGLNLKVQSTFAPTDPATGAVDQVLYAPSSGIPAAFPLTLLPLDPLRLEGVNPGNFTLRWAMASDFAAQSCTPMQGDTITIDEEDYLVEQIQADLGGGIRLMLLKAPL